MNDEDGPRKRRRLSRLNPNPYVLKDVSAHIPLDTDDGMDNVSITCVEYWDGNLYVGTSASEILHLFEVDPPTFILASRLQPSGYAVAPSSDAGVGVQQILVLPDVMKACVLCNGVISFYSLPELSPALPGRELTGVCCIGGLDDNLQANEAAGSGIMIATTRRVLVVRIGERLKQLKIVDFPGCLSSSRRDTIACMADDTSYSLVEIEASQKIPLSPICTTEVIPSPGHSRSKSDTVSNPEQRVPSPLAIGGRRSSRPRSSTDVVTLPTRIPAKLRPNILSPSPEEFIFTTGTAKNEPGVGVFVNLEGDVSRGTIEFERYPESLLLHNFNEGQFIIALLDKSDVDGGKGLEIQELSDTVVKEWLPFPEVSSGQHGLHSCLSSYRHSFQEIAELLQSVKYEPALSDRAAPEYEQKRTQEERVFVARLGHVATKAVTWSGRNLWQLLPNPLLLQLEHRLLKCGLLVDDVYDFNGIDVAQVLSLLGSIRDKETQDETEYLTLGYVRQKASVALFLHLQTKLQHKDTDRLCRMVASALEDGQIDPRVILLLIPPLAKEVLQGEHGIWLPRGIVDVLTSFTSSLSSFDEGPIEFWLMVRQYLNAWLGKRGYGSITDEKLVFDSVEAALLHTLLYLDQALPEGSGMQASVRTKLNNVVDHWNGDFQTPIVLLEQYQRLFVLSRLYQSRKLAKEVLATWKRILEGERDADRSLTSETVEMQMRRYLTKIGNATVFSEYGLWLAQRSPDLAVQIFADDDSRVKLSPPQVVAMLKEQAPDAVQQYLEHLVFVKHLDQYADDLIGYYLDSVLDVLEQSDEAKKSLEQTYTTYRALTSPKPTYLDFIAQNAPPEPWWQSRLRLLRLLAAASGKDLTYSVDVVLERLKPFSTYLVSESIILDARQGRHKEALRLLTHGLGDYDTAVRYCYFGGPTTSQPIDASLLPSRETQQDLFGFLFHEFLRIEDVEERLDRTSHLLGKFASWFEPTTVVESIPDDWTVDALWDFLLRSLRAATSRRHEAIIVKALSAAQNIQKQAEYIGLCEKFGFQLED